MTLSVLLRLPDRPGLSEHPNMAACSLCQVPAAGNQQELRTRERRSKRWPHPIFLGSSWFSPLVGELWLRVSLNDQGQATFRTGDWFSAEVNSRPSRRGVKDCITQIERQPSYEFNSSIDCPARRDSRTNPCRAGEALLRSGKAIGKSRRVRGGWRSAKRGLA